MHLDRSRRQGGWLLAASLVLALVLPGAGAAAAAPVSGPAGPGASERSSEASDAVGFSAAPAAEVVLITGDRVQVRREAGGRLAATVEPVPGRETEYEVVEQDGQLYVYPVDAVGLVPDVLDPELFNVTKLADYGYTGG
ncbi:MAG: hypothetical protein ACRDT2_19470, partial [Natronosporangium sp.]